MFVVQSKLLLVRLCFFFFNDTATTEIYTLSLHDALPIFRKPSPFCGWGPTPRRATQASPLQHGDRTRSEEHTSELQSLAYLVCRLLLEKKNTKKITSSHLISQSHRTEEWTKSLKTKQTLR